MRARAGRSDSSGIMAPLMDAASSASTRRRVWSGRALQFAFNGATGFIVPFLGLFYKQAGLSGIEIGFLVSLGAVVSLLGAPLWGTLADRTGRPIRALQVALAGAGFSALFLGRQSTMLGLGIGTAAFTGCVAGAWPLVDLISLAQVRGTKVGFGAVRLGGSLGWTAVVVPAGLWLERTSLWSGFLGGAVAYFLTALLATRFLEPVREASIEKPGAGFFGTLRKSPPLMLMAAALLIFGVGFTGPKQFMAIYIADLGGSEVLVGLVSGLGAFFEWPFMLLADRLSAQSRPSRVMRRGLLIFAFGWLVAAVIPSAAWYIPARIIVSASYSFYIVGLVSTVSRRLTMAESGTGIAFFTVTLPAVADLLGGPVSGWSYDLAGGRAVHIVAAILGALSWLVMRRLPPADASPHTSSLPSARTA